MCVVEIDFPGDGPHVHRLVALVAMRTRSLGRHPRHRAGRDFDNVVAEAHGQRASAYDIYLFDFVVIMPGALLEVIMEDAARGGSVCHPLTLKFLLALQRDNFPSKEILEKQTARSVSCFKAMLPDLVERFDADELRKCTMWNEVLVGCGMRD